MSSDHRDKIRGMDHADWKEVKDCLISGKCIDAKCTELDLCWFFLHGCLAASNRFVEEEIPEGDEDRVSAEEKKLCRKLLQDDCRLKGDLDRLMRWMQSIQAPRQPIKDVKKLQLGRGGNPYVLRFDIKTRYGLVEPLLLKPA
jgi:hypothetical protein